MSPHELVSSSRSQVLRKGHCTRGLLNRTFRKRGSKVHMGLGSSASKAHMGSSATSSTRY